MEEVIKLVRGKDFDVKKDQGAVIFAQLVSGKCFPSVPHTLCSYEPRSVTEVNAHPPLS